MMKKVISIVIALTIMMSIAIPVSVSAVTKVAGVKQIGHSTTSVEISWNRYNGADKYKIEYSDTATGSYTEDTSYNTDGTESIYNLFAGVTYYVRVTPHVGNSWLTAAASEPFAVVTAPNSVSDLKQTNATASSITLSWSKSDGATSYNIYKHYSSDNIQKIGSTKSNSYTVKGLSNKKSLDFSYIYVYPVRSSGTYDAQGSYTSTSWYYNLRLAPPKGAAPKIGAYYYSSSNNVYFSRPDVKFQDGYQFKIYKTNSKKAVKTLTNETSCTLSKNQFYKVKTRSYAQIGGKKVWGKWSKFSYFVPGLKTIGVTSKSQHSVRIHWSKAKGGKIKYDIYVTKSYSKDLRKFKKNYKKTSIKVTKCGKRRLERNTYYYFYVKPKIKVGKKFKASQVYNYVTTYTAY